jgi:hypothetical protein
MAVDASGDVLEREALHQRRRAGRHFDAFDAAAHAAARFVERLPVLGRDQPRHLVEVLLHQLLHSIEHLRARVHGRVAPRRKRLGRGLHGGIHVGRRRKRRPPDDIAESRVVNVEELGGLGFHPAAADEVVECQYVRRRCRLR